jgi:ribosomal protein L11 methylase PrmA
VKSDGDRSLETLSARTRVTAEPHPASYRDPSGRVYVRGDRVFRTVNARAAADYECARDSGLLDELAKAGLAVETREVAPAELGLVEPTETPRYLLEHSLVPFISYPYEWSFSGLKTAALHHLAVHQRALRRGLTLSDASAYNIQFVGPRPVFIDMLSLRKYRDGELWMGQRQFCEQFLNPLLLRAYVNVAPNSWYRGSLEGIPSADLVELLPWRRILTSWTVLSQVYLPARLQARAEVRRKDAPAAAKLRGMPRATLLEMLAQLERFVERLELPSRAASLWSDYADAHTYAAPEVEAKRRFIAEFASAVKPRMLWDLGCNTGEYSELALRSGAHYVVGFDADHGALELAFSRARNGQCQLLPLYLDAANPSPSQGWSEAERSGLSHRANADALVALAFEHHLAIGRNVPLDDVMRWLVGMAPLGVIEFVQKDDPTVQKMLRAREDIFDSYSESTFVAALERFARIVKAAQVSARGRKLFWYARH